MKKLLFACTLMSLFLVTQSFTNVKPVTGYAIGDMVEDFKLQSVDGSWIQLSEYMGNGGAIVIFTCNTCPYAQLYEQRIIELHNEYKDKGYPVVAINPNDPTMKPGDSYDAMKERSTDKGFTFPYVFDAEQSVFPKFGATRTPHAFLIDKEMTLRYIGAIDDNPQSAADVKVNYITAAIEAVENGQDPDPTSTKAIGCGIKARKTQ